MVSGGSRGSAILQEQSSIKDALLLAFCGLSGSATDDFPSYKFFLNIKFTCLISFLTSLTVSWIYHVSLLQVFIYLIRLLQGFYQFYNSYNHCIFEDCILSTKSIFLLKCDNVLEYTSFHNLVRSTWRFMKVELTIPTVFSCITNKRNLLLQTGIG